MNLDLLRKDLIVTEGLWLKPYRDSVGKLTIGVGRNLDDVGITKEEAFFLLDNDIKRVLNELATLEVFPLLSEPRQRVIAEMAFNLGVKNLMEFKDMWKAIQLGDWNVAADEMQDSLWSKQVGRRATRLIMQMRTETDAIPQSTQV